MNDMKDKICLITGGAGSVGLASARALLEEGARVHLVDHDERALLAATQALASFAGRVAHTVADVADAEQTRGYIAATRERWGGPIDFLFCNAGVNGAIAPITEYPDDAFDRVMAVNVRGSFLALKHGLPALRDGGSVLINASVVAVTADPGICGYATSKHALVGLMRVAAKEAARRGIRVNVIAPGPIDNTFQGDIEQRIGTLIGRDATKLLNSMIPLGRHATPEEIAQTVLFLASPRSSFATGGIFMADGGMSI